jgi:lipopolysaccharide/colanic/teichoic acid biosynthesis glycosyltransferase
MRFANRIALGRKLRLPFARQLPPLSGLSDPVRTRKILERERARADRTGAPLSVIVFAPRCSEYDDATAARLAQVLCQRLRSTDETGWFDKRQICAILPATTAVGARKVVEDICLLFGVDTPLPERTIYLYPDDHAGLTDAGKATTPSITERDGNGPARGLQDLLIEPIPSWKRCLDIIVASIALVVLCPLLAFIALAIKLSSPGPAIFKQRRAGHRGHPFVIYKFRTMVFDAESRRAQLRSVNERDGPVFKVRRDPRVTLLGRILRSSSLDELPQLWNVIKGDMSLVGPRPLPCAETEACSGWHRRRLDVTPGITCIWQVWGRGGVPFAEWARMDVRYIRSMSPWQDLKLLLLTVPAVILRRGAH